MAGPHSTTAVAALFLVDTAATLLLQIRITQRLARGERGPAMAAGMAVMGAAFVIPLLAAPYIDSGEGNVLTSAAQLVPVLLAVVVLAVGRMIVKPFTSELIAAYGGERLTGTYFGAFYLMAGLLTLGLSSAVGAAVDRAGGPLSWWPAVLCAGTGFASAGAAAILYLGGCIPTANPKIALRQRIPPLPSKQYPKSTVNIRDDLADRRSIGSTRQDRRDGHLR